MNPFTYRYPGRFIVIGKDADAFVILYGATGRSPASLARRYVQEGNAIYAVGFDDTVKKEGNPELLEYPAIKFVEHGILVANGRQIEKIATLTTRDARQQLSYGLSEEAYEPDEYRTPRITGCLVEGARGMDGALHIVRSVTNGIDRSSWSVPFETGKGLYIGTYIGEDVRPTPSFSGNPIPVALSYGSAAKAARALSEGLAPQSGETDYRVGFVAVYKKLGEAPEIAIVNRIDL